MRSAGEIAAAGIMAAMMVAAKFAMDALPNIELISLLLIAYTLELPRLALPAVYTYVCLYGLIWGFGIWWFPQLYIWLVLYGVIRVLRKTDSGLVFSVASALFGLSYGALYALSYGLANGAAAGIAWWVSGIPFDLLHCGGNFVCALLLLGPLRKTLRRCRVQLYRGDQVKGEKG